MACHPPPPPGGIDPYQTLGLTHNATPTQIKVAYRKLALRYHPDRQQQSPTTVPTGSQQSSSAADAAVAAAFVRCAKEATDKFSEIAAAYAKLSDPARKKEYDHLYKFGAFDDLDNDQNNSDGHNAGTGTTGASNYQYTENYSGGYYREGYVPPTAATSFFQQQQQQRAAAAAFQTMQSQDSFFDDLIYSPKSKNQSSNTFASTNKNTTNNSDTNNPSSADENDTATESQRAKQPGIGFSFTPAGKHLSVHVPSRNEIMTNMTRGDMPRGAHLFGTRVTFSQQTSSGLGKLERIANCSADTTTCGGGGGGGCNGSSNKPLKEKKVVSTTTRIAKGQKRIVRRTAHLRPDGTKEVVIEENGVVRRRYIEESANTPNSDNDVRDDNETSPKEKEGEEEGGLQKENKFTLMGLFKTCLAPCSSIAG